MSNYEKVYIGTYTNGESRGIYSFNIIQTLEKQQLQYYLAK